jgi:hypothetical protein
VDVEVPSMLLVVLAAVVGLAVLELELTRKVAGRLTSFAAGVFEDTTFEDKTFEDKTFEA